MSHSTSACETYAIVISNSNSTSFFHRIYVSLAGRMGKGQPGNITKIYYRFFRSNSTSACSRKLVEVVALLPLLLLLLLLLGVVVLFPSTRAPSAHRWTGNRPAR